MQTAQIYNSQFEYDNALPPEDPPEPPNMDGEVNDLMTGEDTDLIRYEVFKRSADEELYDLVPDGFCIELILAASRCTDPAMRSKAADARKALEDHAGKLLDAAWHERMKP